MALLPIRQLRFLLVFSFSFFLLFLIFQDKAFSYYACNSPTYTCQLSDIAPSACNPSGVISTCGWKWGTKYNLGTCQNASGQIEPNSSACIVSSEACCEPNQNNCPCSGSSCTETAPPYTSCPGYTYKACGYGRTCSGINPGVNCIGTSTPAKYCQTPSHYYCYEGMVTNTSDFCDVTTVACDPASDPRCFDTLAACSSKCALPNCLISDVSPSTKTFNIKGTNLQAKGLDKYEVLFSPSGRKDLDVPGGESTTTPVSWADISGATSVSVKAWSTTGSYNAISCGTAGLGSASCTTNTPCSKPGEYMPDCDDGLCGADYTCETCTPPSVNCGGTCPAFESAEILRDGTFVATARPVSSVHKIDFKLYRTDISPTAAPCKSIGMQSTNTGGSAYDLWWGGNGCGTVSYDSPTDYSTGITWQDTDRNDPKLNRFKSSIVKRGTYYIQDFWLTNRYGSDRCSYVIDCNGYTGNGASTDLYDLPYTATSDNASQRLVTDCETNRASPYSFIYGASVKYSCGNAGELYLRFRTSLSTGKAQMRLYYPYSPVASAYTGNSNWRQIRTDLCIQQQGNSCGTDALVDDSCNTANDAQNGGYQCDLARSNASQPDLLYFTGQTDPNNAKPNKTWQANVVGRTYSADVTTSVASGNCTCTASVNLGKFNPKFTISGSIYGDYNGNGQWDGVDNVYSGTDYKMLPAEDKNTKTNGNYIIRDRVAGTYTVKLNGYPRDLWKRTTDNLSVTVGIAQGDAADKNFGMTPYHTITGIVFIDKNFNGKYEPSLGETPYDGSTKPFIIHFSGGTGTMEEQINYDQVNGSYTMEKSTAEDDYSLWINTIEGYRSTAIERYENLKVGTDCQTSLPPTSPIDKRGDALCQTTGGLRVQGNLLNVNFGISPSNIWLQGKGGDMRMDDDFDQSPITEGAVEPYVSLRGSANTPGVVFSGGTSPNFGAGQPSESAWNWLVKNSDSFAVTNVKTSYTNLSNLNRGKITTITTECGAGGIANCTLNTASLVSGKVYLANGDLVLNSPLAIPANSKYTFLAANDLYLNSTIDVPTTSSLVFSSGRDIYVGSSVGVDVDSYDSKVSKLEGVFSADRSFIVQKNASQSCVNGIRGQRLNIQGAVIVNANHLNGELNNQRDLCQNSIYPSLYIEERPDFLFNFSDSVKEKKRIWREIAP